MLTHLCSLIIVAVLFLGSGCRQKGPYMRKEGAAIVSAVSQYQADHGGNLPRSLQSLTPAYLKAEPSPLWQYSVYRSDGKAWYLLTSGAGGWSFDQYNSLTKQWANPTLHSHYSGS